MEAWETVYHSAGTLELWRPGNTVYYSAGYTEAVEAGETVLQIQRRRRP